MRKCIYLFIACVLSWTTTHAQPTMSYDFESKTGIYEEIAGGTTVGSGLLGKDFDGVIYIGSNQAYKEAVTKEGFPIGFDFTFNNRIMNRFAIGTNGYIVLGKDEVTVPEPDAGFHVVGSSANVNVVSTATVGGVLGTGDVELSYKVLGEKPNRVLVVQYRNLGLGDRWGDVVNATAQIQFRLYETSDKIEIIYKDWQPVANMTLTARVGIKGSMEDCLLIQSESDNASWTENLVTSTDTYTMMQWGSDCYPSDGLTYTFLPPANCETPVGQPTDLELISSSIKASGSFKKTSVADHYLVLMSETEALTVMPENGKMYSPGETLGNASVISYDSIDTFTTPENLESAKEYYFHVLATNSFCMYGPKYNTNSPLIGAVVTKPNGPDQLVIAETGVDNMTLKATANVSGDQVLVASTTEPALSEYGAIVADGLFGLPTGILNVGDEIEGGGIVIYKGEAEGLATANSLLENTVYHFKAWSFNGEDNYSSIGATANDITWGRVPYMADFSKMPVYESPIGWTRDGEMFRLSDDINNMTRVLECNIQSADPTNGRVNAMTTPWILLSGGVNRILFDYNMSEWSRMGTSPYNNWNENDLFEIQVSNNGVDFETIYQATSNRNTPQFATATSYAKVYAPFEKFAGEKVKIRIYWKCHKGIKLFLKNFEVEEKGTCDYPVNLNVDKSTLIGGQAMVGWLSQGEEENWEIRYRIAGTEEWDVPLEVKTNPYLITNLPAQSGIELQVRAKCSLASQSEWSETLEFKTGYEVPFVETFKETSLPSGWSLETGILADPTVFCTENCAKQWEWLSSRGTNGVILSPKGSKADDWVLSPVVDLGDGSVNYIFNFELSMLTPQEDNDESYSIIISTDGGKTFSSANVMNTIDKSDLPDRGEKKMFSTLLKGYKGLVRIGIYVKSTTGRPSMVQLTSVSINESCPSDVVANLIEVTNESAKITWEGTADSWLIFTRLASETNKDYKDQVAKELLLTGLEPRTAYEVGITKMCEIGDTARVVIVPFTTLAMAPCDPVTGMTIVPSQYEATISWTGEAMAYNIRYRIKGSTEWIIRKTSENSFVMENLNPETEYEYAIQSVCSTADGDMSEWTETAVFTTLTVTCFIPTSIVAETTYKSVTITWEGEADRYEVAYCKGTENWISSEVSAHAVTIWNLESETAYKVRVRSVCSPTDTSKWSSSVDFITKAIPDCAVPANLLASDINESTVDLTWDADESNLSWDVRYRAGSVTSWTTVKGLVEKKHSLESLKTNTIYLWSVKATCDESRTSAWASQEQFTTLNTGIQSTDYNSLKVFVSNKVLNIVNPGHLWIKRLQLYDMKGQLIGTYDVNSDENVFFPMTQSGNQFVVKVNGDSRSQSFMIVFK